MTPYADHCYRHTARQMSVALGMNAERIYQDLVRAAQQIVGHVQLRHNFPAARDEVDENGRIVHHEFGN